VTARVALGCPVKIEISRFIRVQPDFYMKIEHLLASK
jgi:hypothetical protein